MGIEEGEVRSIYHSLQMSKVHSKLRWVTLSSSTKEELTWYLPRAMIPEGAVSWATEKGVNLVMFEGKTYGDRDNRENWK